ncbi:MAG TPA: TolC family protein [Chryseolinea sp.]|nr:TolC family protein [Chryseolinea sp.]
MIKALTLVCLIGCLAKVSGQPSEALTIEDSYRLAAEQYPMTKQRGLIERSKEYSISNAAKGFLPVITINGQDTYQSDVTDLPIELPEYNVDQLSQHQYKVYGDVSVNLYDGGVIKNQKQSYTATAKVDEQKLEVELYKLKDRINQLFFGVLLLDAQLAQNELLKNDIRRGIQQTAASIANGAALKSSGDVLRAELLKADQKTIELEASRAAYVQMLGLMMGKSLNDSIQLIKPQQLPVAQEIHRPELALYDFQREAINVQNKMLSARNRPKLSLFFQGGYGRPALNMLDNQPDLYYVTGVRLNWTISGFYTVKKEKALLDISRSTIDLQKQTFLYNTNLSMQSQRGDVNKFQNVLASDDEIIHIREKIKNAASAQLGNGVITSNDYFRDVTAEDQARQTKILHEIQLLHAQYNLHTTAGI